MKVLIFSLWLLVLSPAEAASRPVNIHLKVVYGDAITQLELTKDRTLTLRNSQGRNAEKKLLLEDLQYVLEKLKRVKNDPQVASRCQRRQVVGQVEGVAELKSFAVCLPLAGKWASSESERTLVELVDLLATRVFL